MSEQTSSSPDLFLQQVAVPRATRELQNVHSGAIVWFTGLSGAGKSTLAYSVEKELHRIGCHSFVLDGDNMRHGLCSDLDFSAQARSENVRRIAEVAKLFLEAGTITLVALISPFRDDRERVRKMFATGDYYEIYCKCPIEVCEMRDVKGIYRKARAGLIAEFTGIASPYEAPERPDLVIDTDEYGVDECVKQISEKLSRWGIIGES